MSYLTDIRNYICNNATVASYFTAVPVCGQSLFIGFEPDSPDNCITIYPYGGLPPEQGTKEKYNGKVQVRVRGTSFPLAYNTCQHIINQMHYNTSVLASTNGIMLAMESQPIYLTRDDENRSIFVCNFRSKFVRY